MAHRFFLLSTIKSPFWTNAFFKRADIINLCFSLPNGKNIQSQYLVCVFFSPQLNSVLGKKYNNEFN